MPFIKYLIKYTRRFQPIYVDVGSDIDNIFSCIIIYGISL